MYKKIAVLATALAISAPAFADRGNHRGHGQGYGHGYGHRHVVVQKHHYVPARPVVHHVPVYHYYRPAPRPVVVVHRPAPVYHYSSPDAGAALLVGAVLGAAIVHSVVTGY